MKHKYPKMFVNYTQTKEERRAKYKLLRKAKFNHNAARRMRDWTLPHIKQVIKYINEI
jgi:hypothetical protein